MQTDAGNARRLSGHERVSVGVWVLQEPYSIEAASYLGRT
ncbi:hypothetical protein MMMDOFMJ_3955 [Methylobacterium gnaphalii]|nr:hypothetical protein MMMDOFMJ_3955 [Methylobacterium gnaphalii]